MTTLTAPKFARLLDRLFELASASRAEISHTFAGLSSEEQTRLMQSKTDYVELYGRLKNAPLAV